MNSSHTQKEKRAGILIERQTSVCELYRVGVWKRQAGMQTNSLFIYKLYVATKKEKKECSLTETFDLGIRVVKKQL